MTSHCPREAVATPTPPRWREYGSESNGSLGTWWASCGNRRCWRRQWPNSKRCSTVSQGHGVAHLGFTIPTRLHPLTPSTPSPPNPSVAEELFLGSNVSSEVVGLRNIATVALAIARAAAANPKSIGTHHLVPNDEQPWDGDAAVEVGVGGEAGAEAGAEAPPGAHGQGDAGLGAGLGAGGEPAPPGEGATAGPKRVPSASVLTGL